MVNPVDVFLDMSFDFFVVVGIVERSMKPILQGLYRMMILWIPCDALQLF